MRASLIVYELFLMVLSVGVYGSAFVLTAAVALGLGALLPWGWPWWGFLMPVLVVVFIVGVIASVGLLRFVLPAMNAGHFTAPVSPAFYIWTLHLSLNRLIFIEPLHSLILYSSVLRYLALRALGAKLAYGTSISARVSFTDLPFIEIGEGCIVGANSLLTGHYLNKGNLFLGKIVIGERVNVGGYCRIGPGVEIGDDTWIGADCQIAPMVTIGKKCTLEPGSTLAPGTHLPDGATYPPQESAVW